MRKRKRGRREGEEEEEKGKKRRRKRRKRSPFIEKSPHSFHHLNVAGPTHVLASVANQS